MKDAISTLNKVINKKETQEDDCDRYGKILANKLRKLSDDERLQMMYEIDGLFIKKMRNWSGAYDYAPLYRNNVIPPCSPSPKNTFISPSPSSTYWSNSSYSSYSDVPPRQYSASSPMMTRALDNMPVLHIPETSHVINESPHSSSRQITVLSDELVYSPKTDIVNTAFNHAMRK